jgi:hypothetical protein
LRDPAAQDGGDEGEGGRRSHPLHSTTGSRG